MPPISSEEKERRIDELKRWVEHRRNGGFQTANDWSKKSSQIASSQMLTNTAIKYYGLTITEILRDVHRRMPWEPEIISRPVEPMSPRKLNWTVVGHDGALHWRWTRGYKEKGMAR